MIDFLFSFLVLVLAWLVNLIAYGIANLIWMILFAAIILAIVGMVSLFNWITSQS